MATENVEIKFEAEGQALPILQQGSRHYRLDLSGKRVTFLDKRFYFTAEGVAVPSVTTILEAYPKGAAFFEWLKRAGEDADEIRDEAGKRGSNVHRLTEEYDKGERVTLLTESGEIAMSMVEWSMFERYVQFRATNPGFEIIEIEKNLVTSDLGYGGTKDRILSFGGKKVLIDIKTSSMVHDHYWLQLAAYKQAHNKLLMDGDPTGKALREGHIDEVAILWLNAKTRTDKPMNAKPTKDGIFSPGVLTDCQGKGWQFILRDQADQLRDWNLFQATQKLWIATNENAAPKNLEYCTEYKFQTQQAQIISDEEKAVSLAANGKGPIHKK